MSYMGKSYEEINSNMKQLLPETADNSFADYPMTGGKWLVGKDKVPGGGENSYCFIRTEDKMPKGIGHSGYVWGVGSYGTGYYHLLTKEGHRNLASRLKTNKVYTGESNFGCGCFGQSKSSEDDAIPTELPVKLPAAILKVLLFIFQCRSVSTLANDEQAKKDYNRIDY